MKRDAYVSWASTFDYALNKAQTARLEYLSQDHEQRQSAESDRTCGCVYPEAVAFHLSFKCSCEDLMLKLACGTNAIPERL